jgi:hypothetical protein
MNTSLKVILTAIGIAVLASPVMAQPESSAGQATMSPVTAQSASHPHNAHGSVARANTAPVVEGSQIHINPTWVNDAVHVPFPQR